MLPVSRNTFLNCINLNIDKCKFPEYNPNNWSEFASFFFCYSYLSCFLIFSYMLRSLGWILFKTVYRCVQHLMAVGHTVWIGTGLQHSLTPLVSLFVFKRRLKAAIQNTSSPALVFRGITGSSEETARHLIKGLGPYKKWYHHHGNVN